MVKSVDNTQEHSEQQQLKRQLRTQLKQIIAPESPRLRLALLFAVLGAVLFIGQSWLLAQLFFGLLDNAQSGADLTAAFNSRYAIALALCFTLRPTMQYVRERLSQAASLSARKVLRKRLLDTLA